MAIDESDDVTFDHLDLDREARDLIKLACNPAKRIELARMDKEIGSSIVWQARFNVYGKTGLWAIKIADKKKIDKEIQNIAKYLSVIYADTYNQANNARIHLNNRPEVEKPKAVLIQPLVTTNEGRVESLRHRIQRTRDPKKVIGLIDRLYAHMKQYWYNETRRYTATVGELTQRWTERIDLREHAKQICKKSALEQHLIRDYKRDIPRLSLEVESILKTRVDAHVGLIHGDLHAQNVNMSSGGELRLIDFETVEEDGWRVLDFAIMELALRFTTTPAHAPVKDLLRLDEIADQYWEDDPDLVRIPDLPDGLYFEDQLEVIGAAVCRVRHWCRKLGFVESLDDYRKALIAMSAFMARLSRLVNKRYVFRSLAFQVTQLNGKN